MFPLERSPERASTRGWNHEKIGVRGRGYRGGVYRVCPRRFSVRGASPSRAIPRGRHDLTSRRFTCARVTIKHPSSITSTPLSPPPSPSTESTARPRSRRRRRGDDPGDDHRAKLPRGALVLYLRRRALLLRVGLLRPLDVVEVLRASTENNSRLRVRLVRVLPREFEVPCCREGARFDVGDAAAGVVLALRGRALWELWVRERVRETKPAESEKAVRRRADAPRVDAVGRQGEAKVNERRDAATRGPST